jgi:hypothetical protein
MTDKNPAEKSWFDFFAGFVLGEELGGGARHQSAKNLCTNLSIKKESTNFGFLLYFLFFAILSTFLLELFKRFYFAMLILRFFADVPLSLLLAF